MFREHREVRLLFNVLLAHALALGRAAAVITIQEPALTSGREPEVIRQAKLWISLFLLHR